MSWLGAGGYPDVHPPLFYWLLRGWEWFGVHEFWLRTLPVLASLGALVLWGRVAGAGLSVLLLATSFADVQQARELRMYAPLEFFAVAHVLALLRRRWNWAALTLLAASFTHLFGLFLIPVGWFLGCRRYYWMQAGCFCLWLGWGIPHYRAELATHPLGLRQIPSVLTGVEAVGRLVTGRVAAFGDPLSLVAGVLVLGWLLWRRPACPAWVYAWALGPWLFLWLLSRLTPISLFEFKYVVWTLPAWTMLLGTRQLVPLWVVVNLWGMIPWLLWPHQWMADWRGVAAEVRGSSEAVVVHPSMMGAPLLYYGVRPQFVDEFAQLKPGHPMIWVTTPYHPYVVAQGLLRGVNQYWERVREQDFDSRLPSAQVEVSWWVWRNRPADVSGGRQL